MTIKSKEQMQENKCCICKKKAFSNGVGVTLYSVSESGKIMDMNETKTSSMQVIVPLCAYHMVLINEELMCFTTQKQILSRGKLKYYEEKPEKELRKIIKDSLNKFKLTRKQIQEQEMVSELKIAVTIDEARKFDKGVNKPIKSK